jgi:hypothetical protein
VPGFDFSGTVHRLHEDLLRTHKARCESQIVGYGEVRSHGRGTGTNTVQSTLAVAYLSAAGEHPRERRACVVQQVEHVGCPNIMNEASIKAAQPAFMTSSGSASRISSLIEAAYSRRKRNASTRR